MPRKSDLVNSSGRTGLKCLTYPILIAMASEEMHMLAIPIPLQGHINPLLHLLRRLASPRLVTTLLVPDSDLDRMRRFLVHDPFIRVLGIPKSILDLGDLQSMPSMQQMLRSLDGLEGAQAGIVELLMPLMDKQDGDDQSGFWGVPVKCVMVDLFIHMGQDLADKLKLPRIGLWTASTSTLLVNHSIPQLISEKVVPSTEMDDLPITFIPGLQGFCRKHLPHSLLYSSLEHLLSRIRTFGRTSEAACVLLNTIEELESEVIAAMQGITSTKYMAVGPLLPLPFLNEGNEAGHVGAGAGIWEEDIHCLGWLDKQAPSSVLYLSFGSMATLSAPQFEQIALGLESSKQPFLWVIRPNLVKDLPDGFSKSFIERTRAQGLVISWAPQMQVLRHGSVGGFLTHCGWNSTFEAICCGMPLLGWPIFAEQNLNCKFIADDWRIGLRFSRRQDGLVDKDEVVRVVRLLMVEDEGKNIKKRAVELRDAVKRAVRQGGSSDVNLKAFVDYIAKL